MKKIIYVSDSYAVGGTELYIFRLFEYAKDHYDLYTFTLNETLISDECLSKLHEYNVKIARINETRKGYKILNLGQPIEEVIKNEETYIFATSLRCFIATSYIRNLHKNYNIYNFLYVLHPEAALSFSYDTFKKKSNKLGFKILLELMRTFFIYPYRRKVFEMIENHQVVFMDEQTYENTKRVYRAKRNTDYLIVRLGLNIKLWSKEYRSSYEKYHILTVSRMDFPFKGYVMGLISDFVSIKTRWSGAKLTIIGDGRSDEEVQHLLNGIPNEIRKDITWVKHVDFDDLQKYFKKAMVFVGMGTSILNAAQYGEYSCAAEPPVQCSVSHLSRRSEPQ